MSTSQSLPQSDGRITVTTPSATKIQEWEKALSGACPQWVHKLQTVLASVRDLLYSADGAQTTDEAVLASREAALYAMQEQIRQTCESYEIDLPRPSVPPVDHQAVDAHHTLLPAPETHIKEKASTTKGTNHPEHPSVSKETSVINAVVDLWDNALAELGIVQGTAENNLPVYVGGRIEGSSEPPVIIELTMGLSDKVTLERAQEIQSELWAAFCDLSWTGQEQERLCTVKLHPWAVINWVNFFTGSLLDVAGLDVINKTVRHATQRNDLVYSVQSVDKAKELARDESKPPRERQFYTDLAAILSHDVESNNTHVMYTKRLHAAEVVVHFEAMVSDLLGELSAPSRERPDMQLAQPLVLYESARNDVGQACANQLGWSLRHFWDFLERHEGLYTLATDLSNGIVLLITPELQALIRASSKGAMPGIVEAVKDVFPEFQGICDMIQAMVDVRLAPSEDGTVVQAPDQSINIGAGEEDMVTRIRNAFHM